MFQVPTVSVLGVHGRGLWVSQELWGGPYVCFRLIGGGGGGKVGSMSPKRGPSGPQEHPMSAVGWVLGHPTAVGGC